jgi:monoterpene epsilon-lactone hydrolase
MDVVWIALVITLGITVTIVFGLSYWLRGASQDAHGHLAPSHQRRFSGRPMDAPEQRQVLALLEGVKPLTRLPLRERIAALRKFMDALFVDHAHQAQFRPVQAGDVRAEWVIVPGADSSRRTLYIHGGAFMMGSPTSHRPLTEHFSRLTDGAVLAVDYRLMPEFKRSVGIEDCRSAYRWLIDNGPEGPAPVSALFVAGDSAGGNLTLSVIAWARDAGLRPADAAVALSPATDATLVNPALKANLATDPMLLPIFGTVARLPGFLMPFFGWLLSQRRPCDPVVSPLHGNLDRLPPVLIQVSECEMLYDDCKRYVAKAVAAGSPAELQSWQNMVHVWQLFGRQLPEAGEALAQIGLFIERHAPRAAKG